jgi:hypothetical protein
MYSLAVKVVYIIIITTTVIFNDIIDFKIKQLERGKGRGLGDGSWGLGRGKERRGIRGCGGMESVPASFPRSATRQLVRQSQGSRRRRPAEDAEVQGFVARESDRDSSRVAVSRVQRIV